MPRHLLRIALFGSVLMALCLGCGGGDSGPRVWIIGLDGADWDQLDPLIAAGEMPNLARLRAEGAWGRLMSDEPMLSPILWTSIATGKTADLHGVTWFMSDAPDGSKIPVSSRNRWVRTVWNIASENDQKVGILGWWATWPAEPVKGFLVSDYVAYHSFGVTGSQMDVPGKTWPSDLMRRVDELFPAPHEVPSELLLSMVNTTASELDRGNGAGPYGGPVQHLRQSVATSLGYTLLAKELLAQEKPRLFAVYYEGTDATEHLFNEMAPPRLPWVSDEDFERYSGTTRAYWKWQDELLGELLEERDDNTIVMIVSDHGFRTGDERLKEDAFSVETADLSHMPDGVVLMHGPGIAAGVRIERANIYDVTPTVLHLLGLPVAEDMSGRVLEAGLKPEYRQTHPVQSTPTYETGPWDRGDEIVVDQQAGENMEEMLRSLGYIGGGGESGEAGTAAPNVEQSINLAVVLRKQARYEEALILLEEVLETSPEQPEARFNLGNTYAEMGRIEEAAEVYAALVLEQPDELRNHENLALSYGKLNRPGDALRVYDAALERHPEWAPAIAGRGFALHELGREEEAIGALDLALEMDPRAADSWYYRGATLADLGRLEESREDLERALQLDPAHDPARRRLGRVLLSLGNRSGAEEVLRGGGVAAGPGAKAQLGSMALQEGRVAEALPLLEEAAPALNDPEIWGNLGMAYAMSGDLPRGAEAFERVLELRPEMLDARAQLAAFYAQMGRMQEAERLMIQVLEAEPENGRYHLQLGIFFAMQGKEAEAQREIARAKELDPELPMPPGFE